eukprot:1306461-Rhodomonas_salina.1
MLPDSGEIVSPPARGVKKLGCLAKYKPGTDKAVKQPPGKRGRPKKGDAGAAGSSQSGSQESGSQAQCGQQHNSLSLTQQQEQEDKEDSMDEDERNGSRGAYWSLTSDSIRLLHCIVHPDMRALFANMENVQNKDQLDSGKTDKKEFWDCCCELFCDLDWKPEVLFQDDSNFMSGTRFVLDPSRPV